MQFIVDRREAGQTLASVLKKHYSLSWAQAKRLIEGRHVRINNQIEADIVRRVKAGKTITISAGAIDLKTRTKRPTSTRDPATREAKPGAKGNPSAAPGARDKAAAKANSKATASKEPKSPKKAVPLLDPEVLVYSDDAIVVVNKPAGLTTMRHAEEAAEFGEHGQRFLTRTLAGMLPTMLGAPSRPVYAVHRLDRDTSGLVVFARTPEAEKHLTQQFRKHTIDRRYLALTRGAPLAGRIESTLVRDRGDGRRGTTRKSKAEDGKLAVTNVKVREALGEFALIECRLATGRTHQIRIHLGEAGAPLCGETVYDRAVNRKPLPDESGARRPMLHAARLGLRHPETGETMTWNAPPPQDFKDLLTQLKG